MEFWQIAFKYEWVTAEQLKGAVKTEDNKFGEITVDQYKEITKLDFALKEETPTTNTNAGTNTSATVNTAPQTNAQTVTQ
jgi:hypothetical protein